MLRTHKKRPSPVVRSLIEVRDAVFLDIGLRWVRCQRPQYIKTCCSANHDEGQHAPSAFHIGLEISTLSGRQKRQKPLRK